MVEIAARVGREALLSSLQDDHPDLAFSCYLLADGVVEDALGCVEDERLDWPSLVLIFSADCA